MHLANIDTVIESPTTYTFADQLTVSDSDCHRHDRILKK